jgi:hypothetical protein
VPLIDLERLIAYKQILLLPDDPVIKDYVGYRRTQPPKSSGTLVTDLKAKYVHYLMYRQLEIDGDL